MKKEVLEKYINERVAQHQENLRLWNNGTLVPTEPDEMEREKTKERLRAAIYELEQLRTFINNA